MSYQELVFEIKRLLFLITNENGYILNNLLYMNVLLNSNLYRGDIESIREEISTYFLDLIKTIGLELMILNKMYDYISYFSSRSLEDSFINSYEFTLFEGIVKTITNSSTKRMKEVEYVIYTYKTLFATNSFNRTNYKIAYKEHYVSDETYYELLNTIPKK